MSEMDAKVNMSLDDIIKLEKKKKAGNLNNARGQARRGRSMTRGSNRGANLNNARGQTRRGRSMTRASSRPAVRGNSRGGIRGGGRGGMRSTSRARSQSRNRAIRGATRGNFKNKPNQIFKSNQGQWKRGGFQNGARGGFANRRFNNRNEKSNLTRSQSNLSLNKVGQKSNIRGGFNNRRGGKFGLTRSRSRTNVAFNKPEFSPKMGSLKRTSSAPNLRDPSSVHNRLGYQSPKQLAYRNRVKKAKQLLLQRQNKMMGKPARFGVPRNFLQKRGPQQGTKRPVGSLRFNPNMRTDALGRKQQQQQKFQMGDKFMRINPFNSSMGYLNNANQQPLYQATQVMMGNTRPMMQRGRSPFRRNMNMIPGGPGQRRANSQPRSRSRSRSRSRNRNFAMMEPMIQMRSDPEDRGFSEVMYSLAGNFGITGRTLNDRFSY